MSKYLDLTGLSYYNEKVLEAIESKKGVYIFDWDYTSNHNNIDINKHTADTLYQAVEEGKLIVVRYQHQTIPCCGAIVADNSDSPSKVKVIGSISKVIDNSTIHGGYFEITIDGDNKLTSTYNEITYDIGGNGTYILNCPTVFTNATSQITDEEIDNLAEAIQKGKIILIAKSNNFNTASNKGLLLPSDINFDLRAGMVEITCREEFDQTSAIVHKFCTISIDINIKTITTSSYQKSINILNIDNSFSDGSITNVGSSKVDLSLSRNKGDNKNISLPMATTTTAGLMTAADKKKLDSIDNELFVVVEQLPDVANANKNKIYIVPSEEGLYNSWFVKDGVWTQLNSFNQDIDLSEYEKNIAVIVITYNKVYNPLETSIDEFNCNKTYQELLDIIDKKIIVKLYTKQGNYLGSTIDAIISPKSDDSGDYVELSFRYHGSSELRYTKNYFEVSTYKARANGTTEATSVCDDLVDASRVIDVNNLVESEEANERNAFIFKTIVEGNYDYILYENIYGNVEGPHGNYLACYGSHLGAGDDKISSKSLNINLYDDGRCSISRTFEDYDVNAVKDFPDILNLIIPNTTLEKEFIKMIYRAYVDFRDNNRVYRVKKDAVYGNIIDMQYSGPSTEEAVYGGVFYITYICGDYLYKIDIQSQGNVTMHQKYLIINSVLDISSIRSMPHPDTANLGIYNTIKNSNLETAVWCKYYGKINSRGTDVFFTGNSIEKHYDGNLKVDIVNIVLEANGTTTITYDTKIIKQSVTIELNDGDAITEEHKQLFNNAKNIDLNITINNESGFKIHSYSTYADTGFSLIVSKIEHNESLIFFKSRSCIYSPGTSIENYVYNFVSNDYNMALPTGTLTGGKYLNDLGHFEDPLNTISLTRVVGSISVSDEIINKISEIARTSDKYMVYYGGPYSGFGWGTKITQTTDAAEDTHYILRVYDTDIETRTKPIILEIDVNATAKTVKYTEIPIISGNDAITNAEIDDLFT